MGTSFHGGGGDGDNNEPDSGGGRETSHGSGGGYLPPLHAQPRLFSDPSCLPRGGRGADPELLRRLQAIRDGSELRSACILPCMALALTLLTLACQVWGARESPYLPLTFAATFFVYSIERHWLRPRAARQIHEIQRELRRKAQRGGGGGSYAVPRSSSLGLGRGGSGNGGGAARGWLPQLSGPSSDLVGGDDGGEEEGGRLAPVAEASGDYSSRSTSQASSAVLSREGSWMGEVKEAAGDGDEEKGGGGVAGPSEPPRHVTFSSSVVGGKT